VKKKPSGDPMSDIGNWPTLEEASQRQDERLPQQRSAGTTPRPAEEKKPPKEEKKRTRKKGTVL
jgi:hypothetical protein